MGYTLEVSFDITKHPDVTSVKRHISDMALDLLCDHYYYYYETDNGDERNKIPRNHCIVAVHFNESEIFQCAEFIKQMKKIRDIYIECIYEDDVTCKMIYASRYYLKNVDKGGVTIYNRFKRERGYSDHEQLLLDEMEKPKAGGKCL